MVPSQLLDLGVSDKHGASRGGLACEMSVDYTIKQGYRTRCSLFFGDRGA